MGRRHTLALLSPQDIAKTLIPKPLRGYAFLSYREKRKGRTQQPSYHLYTTVVSKFLLVLYWVMRYEL